MKIGKDFLKCFVLFVSVLGLMVAFPMVSNASDAEWTSGSGSIYTTDSGDSVGIGTSSPQQELHITKFNGPNADVRIDYGGTNEFMDVWSAQNGSGIGVYGNRRFSISTLGHLGGTARFRIEYNGDTVVGPKADGTTAPASVFEVDGVLSLDEQSSSPGNTAGVGKFFVKSSDSKPYFKDDSGNEFLLTGDSNQGWTDDGSVVRLTTSSDKVGIGTSTVGSGTAVKLTIKGTNNLEDGGSIQFHFDGTGDGGGAIAGLKDGGLKFYSYGEALGSESYVDRMIIDNSGKVGIGTTSPGTSKLHIERPASDGNGQVLYLRSYTDGANTNILIYGDNNSGQTRGAQFGFDPNLEGLYFDDNGNNTKDVVFKSGKVGIGTTNPSQTLDVNGNINVTGKIYAGTEVFDPPGVLYDYETENSIIEKVVNGVPGPKLTGAVMFFNGEASRMEVYVPAKGIFTDLMGTILAQVTPITETFEVEDKYYLRPTDAEVVKVPVQKYQPNFQVKKDYSFDSKTGKFFNPDGVEVAKKEAIENTAMMSDSQTQPVQEGTQVSKVEIKEMQFAAFGMGNGW